MKTNQKIEEAKSLLRIPDLWARFNLPGTPSKSCRSPWREDKSPSFSVSEDGALWHDFAAGEGGDCIDFIARTCQLSNAAACKLALEFAGGGGTLAPVRFAPAPKPAAPSPRAKPAFPPMEPGTRADLESLAKLRNIPRVALEWTGERGVLRFADLHGVRAWVVTDGEGVNAQARRLDGQPWAHIGAKAWTLPGSWAAWPIGIREAADFPASALCEGGPDFLAAHYFALFEQASHHAKRDVQSAPVGILGAAHGIPADALPLFAGKRVRLFPHADEAGQKAARRWAEELASVGATVDAFDFTGLRRADGQPAKDLNDCLNLDAAGFNETERILS